MRTAFVHDAVLDMAAGADLAAPGGAVTLALCGAFEHPPPCPLAPHHTTADRVGADRVGADRPGADRPGAGVAVRVLFAAEPADEAAVRFRIEEALAAGSCAGPDGTRTSWTVRESAPGAVRESDRAHAARLAAD